MYCRKPEPAGVFRCVIKPWLYNKSNAKYFTLKPPGKERFVRIDRRLGEAYSLEGIAKRIGERIHAQGFSQNEEAAGAAGTRQDEKRKTKRTYAERPRYRITGFKALYIRYCYMLGCYPKHMTAKQVNYLYREDLTKLRKIRSETKFLCKNKIETLQDLVDVEYELKQDLKRYQNEKQYVINRLLSASGDE